MLLMRETFSSSLGDICFSKHLAFDNRQNGRNEKNLIFPAKHLPSFLLLFVLELFQIQHAAAAGFNIDRFTRFGKNVAIYIFSSFLQNANAS